MGEDVEVLPLDDTVRLGPVRNREVSGYVEKMTKGSHDVAREVGCVVAPQVESCAISSKNCKKRFRS